MKNNLNFIQLANLIFIIKNNLLKIEENVSREDFRNVLKKQKYNLQLFKDILEKKKKLIGIQKDFLKNLSFIKKELNLEENKCHHSQ